MKRRRIGTLAGALFLLSLTIPALGQPDLTVTPTCPGGGPITISWTGASSGNVVMLVWARGQQGGLVIPTGFPCAGTQMGLGRHRAQIVHTGPAGSGGANSIGRFAGPSACNGFLQLVDVGTCQVSQVVDVDG